MTGLAVVVAVALIGFLVLKPFGASGSGSLPQELRAPSADIPASIPRDGLSLGSPSAKLIIDEWEDFQCPACGLYTRTVEPTIIQTFVTGGLVRLVFHDDPFIGRESTDAAVAARCAADQGKFWEYHEWLYWNQNGENKGWFSRDRLAAIAAQVGLDTTAWSACYDGGSPKQAISADVSAGAALGINQTPTLTIDGDKIAFTDAADLISQVRARLDALGAPAPSAATSTAP